MRKLAFFSVASIFAIFVSGTAHGVQRIEDKSTTNEAISGNRHVIDTYDILGIYVEGVLGDFGELPPVRIPEIDSGLQPSAGYPVLVQMDGTIALPLIETISARGLAIEDVRTKIRQAYTQGSEPILIGKPIFVVTLMKPRPIDAKESLPGVDYKISALDVLGIYVESITGMPGEVPPVRFVSPKEGIIPSAGYPVLVLPDGTICLPLIDPLQVNGLTIEQVKLAIKNAYKTGQERDHALDRRESDEKKPKNQAVDQHDRADEVIEAETDFNDPMPRIPLEDPSVDQPILRDSAMIIVTLMRPSRVESKRGTREDKR